MGEYVMDSEAPPERGRLQLLEAWADPGTTRCLAGIGVGAGWRCLEVGAGAGSIARWLSGQVGPHGQVVATDVDIRFLQDAAADNVEVRRHDIREGPPVTGAFDLVHARMLLEHLPEPARVLAHLCAALKPGGWLVVEDQDVASVAAADPDDPRGPLFMERSAQLVRALTSVGMDLQLGRKLHGLLCRAGLADVGAEGRVAMVPGGSAVARFWRGTWDGLRLPLTRSGLLSSVEIDEVLLLFDDARFVWQSPILTAAWGRVRAA